MTTVTLNGTVEYSGASQSLGTVPSGGSQGGAAVLNTYNNLTFSGSGTKTLLVSITVNGTLATPLTFALTSFNVAMNGTFRIDQGGFASTTGGAFTYGSSATLQFNNSSGSYGVNADVYWPTASGPPNVNVSGAGGITMNVARTVTGLFQTSAGVAGGSALTLNGTAQINTGGFFSTAPNYGSSSTLIYNTGGTYGRGTEWSATSGAGYPNHVQLSGSTTLNLGANSGTGTARQMAGSLTVDSGSTFEMAGANAMTAAVTVNGSVSISGTLRLSTSSGGDINVAGDWTRAAAGTFTPNGRAVFFTGAAVQTISVTGGGTEAFDYIVNNNTSGGTKLSSSPSTSASINATAGNVLSLNGAGPFDVNGQTLTFNNAGGNILTATASRTISSTAAGGSVVIAGSKTASGTGLVFGDNVTVKLSAGMNFGSGVSTIGGGTSGTLQINAGGFVDTNPPKYASGSLLQYNNGASYGLSSEWTASSGTVGTTPGYPYHVQISTSGTTLNFGSINTGRALAKNLTIDTGCGLTLSSVSGGDVLLGGNWTRNGTFTPNSRAVFFNGTSAQSITGSTTFDYVIVNNSAGLTLNSPVTVNQTLTLTSGALTSANNLTLGNGATISRDTGSLDAAPTFGTSANVTYTGTSAVTMGPEIPTSSTVLSNLTVVTPAAASLSVDVTANGTITIDAGSSIDVNGRGFEGGRRLEGCGTLKNTGAAATFTVGALGDSSSFCGTITGPLALTKSGAGTLTLTGTHTHTGNTTVSAGTLGLSGTGSMANSPTISVAAGATLDVTARTDGTLTLGSGQTLKGNGTVAGVVSVNGTLSPGSSVGALTNTGALLLQSGGTNVMEVIDSTNAPGVGYDTTKVSTDIGVLSTSGSKFTIKLLSLNGTGSAGNVTNFNNDTSYTWTNASGNLTNFASDKLQIDDSSFSNDLAGGVFVVEPGSLNLRFTNNHAPTATNILLGRARGTSVRLDVASILSNTGDADDDGRLLVEVGASTNGTSISTNVSMLFFSPTNNLNESFTYQVQDNRAYRAGDSRRTAQAWITVTVTNALSSPTITNMPGGSVLVRFAGIPDYAYEIQRSTNLTDWVTLLLTNAPPAGVFEYTDTFSDIGGPPSAAYYRTRQP